MSKRVEGRALCSGLRYWLRELARPALVGAICLGCVAEPDGGGDMNAHLASPEAVIRGGMLFSTHCTLCHGERGDGLGPEASRLTRKPVDFTDVGWRKSRTAEQVMHSILRGRPGTSMPPFSWMGDDKLHDLSAYILSLSTEP